MRLLIVRHGDPDYSIDSLTEKGWKEAEYLSERLSKLDVKDFYVSPLGRAKDTASFTLKKMKDNGSGVDDIKIPSTSGINVIVWGEESDDSKAVLRLASALGIKGSFHTIELFNLEITTTVENANGRIFNIQDDSNTFTEMKIEACDILDGQVLFRVKHGEGKPSLGILTIRRISI